MHTWRMLATVGLCGSMLVGSGCTRENPGFQDTDPAAPTTGADGSATKGATEDGATEDGNADTTTTEPTDTDEPATDSNSGGDMLCPLHPPEPIQMSVTEGGSPLAPSAACNVVIQRPNGTLLIEGGIVRHQACPVCDCAAIEGLTLDLGTTLSPPAQSLPTCGKLVIWEGLGPDGNCRWDGFAILDQNTGEIPTYLGVNSRSLPEEVFGPVQVDLDRDATCDDVPTQCNQTPGRYALGFTSGPSVSVGMNETVGIGPFAEVDFHVDTRMASIDLECHEHVAWTALQQL